MANDDHIALLKKGVAAWNKWHKENPDICPDLGGADLRRAHLYGADLSGADLSGADLSGADLSEAGLSGADLSGADLSAADLSEAPLVSADLTGADLAGCRIYGVSAWNLKLAGANQQNLIITRADEPAITVDNIEVAQFIYLAKGSALDIPCACGWLERLP